MEYKPKYTHPVPRKRRKRNLAFLIFEVVLIIILLFVLCWVLAWINRPPPEPDKPSTPIHFITAKPRPSPEPTPKKVYPVPLDDDLQQWIIDQCGEDVDPALVLAIIAVETGGTWDSELIGDNGHSVGLMQIYADYHGDRMKRLGVFDLTDPYQNTAVGIDVLKELMQTGNPLSWVLMAYNGGAKYADGMESLGEVSRYAKSVLILKGIYDESIQGF